MISVSTLKSCCDFDWIKLEFNEGKIDTFMMFNLLIYKRGLPSHLCCYFRWYLLLGRFCFPKMTTLFSYNVILLLWHSLQHDLDLHLLSLKQRGLPYVIKFDKMTPNGIWNFDKIQFLSSSCFLDAHSWRPAISHEEVQAGHREGHV